MKILVANRGEIACRVLRTARAVGFETVAMCSAVDRDAPHVWLADEVIELEETRCYLDADRIIRECLERGVKFVHPGYGFLSENAGFSRACRDADITFVGPGPDAIEAFGDKRAARILAEKAKVPVVPGAEACDDVETAKVLASEVGYPILLKAAGGGGGKGMRKVMSPDGLKDAFDGATREATASFSDGRMLLEKYIFPSRHIEIQVLGDGERVVAVGERECSLQRRYQKILEEAPASALPDEVRASIRHDACRLLETLSYSGAGTVEFLVGPKHDYYFLEVNTRLQVEHPVTELVYGLDLVAEQLKIAQGGKVPEVLSPRGHAIEARLNAEDAYGGFLPASGTIGKLVWPQGPGIRVDSGVEEGGVITSDYDSMIAKIIAYGEDREQARGRLIGALKELVILGLVTNQTFLIELLESDYFRSQQTFTSTVEEQTFVSPPVPAYLDEVKLGGATKGALSGAQGDTHSPWQHLGAFRMHR